MLNFFFNCRSLFEEKNEADCKWSVFFFRNLRQLYFFCSSAKFGTKIFWISLSALAPFLKKKLYNLRLLLLYNLQKTNPKKNFVFIWNYFQTNVCPRFSFWLERLLARILSRFSTDFFAGIRHETWSSFTFTRAFCLSGGFGAGLVDKRLNVLSSGQHELLSLSGASPDGDGYGHITAHYCHSWHNVVHCVKRQQHRWKTTKQTINEIKQVCAFSRAVPWIMFINYDVINVFRLIMIVETAWFTQPLRVSLGDGLETFWCIFRLLTAPLLVPNSSYEENSAKLWILDCRYQRFDIKFDSSCVASK